MLTIREQILFVRNMSALLRVGLGLDVALLKLERMMPERKADLQRMAKEVARGRRLSQVSEGLLPAEVLAVLVSGEQSGGIVEVLEEIRETLEMRIKIKKSVKTLYSPLALLLFGLTVFVGFSVGVIPSMVDATSKMSKGKGQGPGGLMEMMSSISSFMINHWQTMLGSIVGIFLLVLLLTRDKKIRAQMYSAILRLPVLGPALLYIHFSLWARYLAMMYRSGYDDLPKALDITARTLPSALLEGMNRFKNDISVGKGMGAASDIDRLPADDPRQLWPVYLQIALMISEKTGEVDTQLQMASEYMLEDAQAALGKVLAVTKLIALVVIALSAGLPMISYLLEMVSMMTGAMKNL